MKKLRNGNGKKHKAKNKKALRNPINLLEETWKLITKVSEQDDLLTERFAETDRQIKEMALQSKETDRKLAEIAAREEKSTADLKKSSEDMHKVLRETSTIVGNMGRNNGSIAEEFFYNGLSGSMSIGDLQFDKIFPNIRCKNHKTEDEFDILMENASSVAIVEVKYKAHENDVKSLYEKKIPNYKILFPKQNLKILGVIAGLSVPDDVRNLAIQYGFIVLTQSGQDIKIIKNELKEY